MPIKIQHLEHFALIAEHKGYRKASKHALRTQAALSISIKSLEKILGARLFEKGQKSQLTPYGKECLPRVQAMLKHFSNLEKYMLDTAKGQKGSLRIGSIPTAAQHILPKILPIFTLENPDIKTALFDNTSQNIYQRLMNNEIDIALATSPELLDDNIEFTPLHTDKLGVMCHKDIPLAKKKSVNLQDLVQYPFISNGISLFMKNPEMTILNNNATHHVENILSLNTAIKLNLGVTILGKMSLSKNDRDLTWIPLNARVNERVLGIMHIKSDELNPIIQNFKTICLQNEGISYDSSI